ncbi:MAG: ACP S-malonyltransferase [bacterium]|nr:ACP S-malonyltransferase [bacterium]
MTKALLFSGQGSQYVGMGRDVCEQLPAVEELFERADMQLGYSITGIMFDGPEDTLKETRNTQPALFVHEAALLEATGLHKNADALAGHSLGEYTALYAAGVLSFADALALVRLRGTLMYDEGLRIPGTMAAVVGLTDEQVVELCSTLNEGGEKIIVPANFNSPGQIVISGSAEYLRASLPQFKAAGAKIVKELAVSGAFHSPLLQGASVALSEALDNTPFNNARCDVYVNVSGEPMRDGSALREAAKKQLTSPVQWTQTLLAMKADGLTEFIEVGPGSVLQGLVKRTLTDVVMQGVDKIADVQRLNALA